jgi:hypothetical protein
MREIKKTATVNLTVQVDVPEAFAGPWHTLEQWHERAASVACSEVKKAIKQTQLRLLNVQVENVQLLTDGPIETEQST